MLMRSKRLRNFASGLLQIGHLKDERAAIFAGTVSPSHLQIPTNIDVVEHLRLCLGTIFLQTIVFEILYHTLVKTIPPFKILQL